jgi:hypothetical protein
VVFGIGQAQADGAPASVDSQRMISADRDAANWLSYDARTVSSASARFRRSMRKTRNNSDSLVCRPRHQSRTAGHAANHRRRDVRVDRLEHGEALRRGNRQTALVVRPRSAARARRQRLLRRRQPRRGGLEGQDLRRYLRWTAGGARCALGQARVEHRDRRRQEPHHHPGAARHQGTRRDRHERRRIRDPGLHLGVRHGDRQACLAALHRTGRSLQAVREPGDGDGCKDLERRVVEAWWRRPGMGRDFVRPRPQSRLLRRGQRCRMGAELP